MVRLGGFHSDGQEYDAGAAAGQQHAVTPRDAAQIFTLAVDAPAELQV